MAKDHEMHKQNDTTSKVEDFVYRKKCADSEKACMIERIEINGMYEKAMKPRKAKE